MRAHLGIVYCHQLAAFYVSKRQPRADRALTGEVQKRLREAMVEEYGALPGGIQERFAEAIGVDASQVHHWLNRNLPDATGLKRISATTGWSVDWLLFGEGPRRRGGAPIDLTLAEQLRAYLVRHPWLGTLEAIELLQERFLSGISEASVDDPDSASGRPIFRYRARGALADHLPPIGEDLLNRTAAMWWEAGHQSANREQAEEALEAALEGRRVPESVRARFLSAYAAGQESVRAYNDARTDLWLATPHRRGAPKARNVRPRKRRQPRKA